MALLNYTAPKDRNNVTVADPLAMYKISDQEQGTINYYGFLGHDGSWYVQKWNTTTDTFRYCAGKGGYLSNWTNRVNLAYEYFDVIF